MKYLQCSDDVKSKTSLIMRKYFEFKHTIYEIFKTIVSYPIWDIGTDMYFSLPFYNYEFLLYNEIIVWFMLILNKYH